MEAYALGTMRNLPDSHPVYKLLKPHFQHIMTINMVERTELFNDGGVADQVFSIGQEGRKELLQRAAREYDVTWTHIKHSIEKRGVANPELLPGYCYRDDGLKVWQAIETFVQDVIREFYTSDDDVKNDNELQSWANDISTHGFPGHQGATQGHGFPKVIQSTAQLTDVCTLIIFTGSGHYAAVSFGQHDVCRFCPNAPYCLRLAPPATKGVASMQTLLDSLPNRDTVALSIAFSHVLSQSSKNQVCVVAVTRPVYSQSIYVHSFMHFSFFFPPSKTLGISLMYDLQRKRFKTRLHNLEMHWGQLKAT